MAEPAQLDEAKKHFRGGAVGLFTGSLGGIVAALMSLPGYAIAGIFVLVWVAILGLCANPGLAKKVGWLGRADDELRKHSPLAAAVLVVLLANQLVQNSGLKSALDKSPTRADTLALRLDLQTALTNLAIARGALESLKNENAALVLQATSQKTREAARSEAVALLKSGRKLKLRAFKTYQADQGVEADTERWALQSGSFIRFHHPGFEAPKPCGEPFWPQFDTEEAQAPVPRQCLVWTINRYLEALERIAQ